MGDNSGLSRAEVEIVARRTVDACQERFRSDFLYALKPLMYEVAEKVSSRNTKELNLILERIFNLDCNDNDSIRAFQQDLFWIREQRNVSETDKASLRNHLLRALVWFPISAFVGFLLAWLGIK
jgi:hypothetical protein